MTIKWHPISTAPQDGTIVLIHWQVGGQPGKGPACLCHWDGAEWVPESPPDHIDRGHPATHWAERPT